MLQRLWKPWFVHRPTQIGRRLYASLSPRSAGYQSLQTSWGVAVSADPTKTIGRNIVTTGLYDIAVSEALVRLIGPGELVIDAGANIGYMTVLSALAAGPKGKVHAFEPHPELFQVLKSNVANASRLHGIAPVELHQSALGDRPGTASLSMPEGFGANDGIATIVDEANAGANTVTVVQETLDGVLGDAVAAVMKLDVEGFEYHVLQGAITALKAKRIRHIVFEDHNFANSEVVRLFQELGYGVYSLGWTMSGLALAPIAEGGLAVAYEAPNFVATVDSQALLKRCAPKGWFVLKSGLGR